MLAVARHVWTCRFLLDGDNLSDPSRGAERGHDVTNSGRPKQRRARLRSLTGPGQHLSELRVMSIGT